MKSEVKVDLRTPYTMSVFNRKNKKQVGIRQKMVRYAQQHGIKPAAQYFGCSKNTVKKWLHRFNKHEAGGLENKSRAPFSCPHKTSQEMENLIIAKRKQALCYGPKSSYLEAKRFTEKASKKT